MTILNVNDDGTSEESSENSNSSLRKILKERSRLASLNITDPSIDLSDEEWLANLEKESGSHIDTEISDDFVFGEDEEIISTRSKSKLLSEDEARQRREIILKEITEGTKIRAAKQARCVQAFDVKSMRLAKEKSKGMDSEGRKRVELSLAFASKNDGLREVPKISRLPQKMDELLNEFPNFKDAINGLVEDFALSSAGKPADFRVSPVLLDGVPGIGKTRFAQELAKMIGVPFLKISAGGLQHAAQIVGTAQHWSNAQTGQIFDLLAKNTSCVAVVLIDEVDKIQNRSDYSIIPALLDLLEIESAREFTDESLLVDIDASQFIILMTSNNQESIDSALLSRASIYSIEEPSTAQRKAIALRMHSDLCKRTKTKLLMDDKAVDQIVEAGTDLRTLNRSIRSAFSQALMQKSKIVTPSVKPALVKKQRIGF